MAQFKVLAEVVNILNTKTGESENLKRNQVLKVEDYDNNQLIFLSNNGKKDSKGEYVYSPSIELLDEVELEPEGEKLDVSAALEATNAKKTVNKKAE